MFGLKRQWSDDLQDELPQKKRCRNELTSPSPLQRSYLNNTPSSSSSPLRRPNSSSLNNSYRQPSTSSTPSTSLRSPSTHSTGWTGRNDTPQSSRRFSANDRLKTYRAAIGSTEGQVVRPHSSGIMAVEQRLQQPSQLGKNRWSGSPLKVQNER